MDGKRTVANLKAALISCLPPELQQQATEAMAGNDNATKIQDINFMSDVVDELVLQDPDHRGECKDVTSKVFLQQHRGRAAERTHQQQDAIQKHAAMRKPRAKAKSKAKAKSEEPASKTAKSKTTKKGRAAMRANALAKLGKWSLPNQGTLK